MTERTLGVRFRWMMILTCLAGWGVAAPPLQGEEENGEDPGFLILPLPDAEVIKHYQEGLNHLHRERWMEGCREMQKLLEREPDAVIAVNEGQYEGVSFRVRRLLKDLPPEGKRAYEVLFGAQARTLYRSGLREGDVGKLRELLRRFPASSVYADALNDLAEWEVEAGKHQNALALYRELELIRPDQELPIRNIRRRMEAEGKYDTARFERLMRGERRVSLGTPHDRKRWEDDVAHPESIRAAFEGERVYLFSGEQACALDLEASRFVWKYRAPVLLADTYIAGDRGAVMQWYFPSILGKQVVFLSIPSRKAQVHIPRRHSNQGPSLMKQPVFDVICLEKEGAKPVWSTHYRRRDAKFSRLIDGLSLTGQPVLYGGRLFVTASVFKGGVNTWVVCLDVESGELIWKTYLGGGQRETDVWFPVRTHVATPMVFHEGKLLICNSLGVVTRLDQDGRIEWLSEYDPAGTLTGWWNLPPVVGNGIFCAAPMDSPYVHAWEVQNGKELWKIPRDPDPQEKRGFQFVLPAGDDGVLLCSDSHAEVRDLQTGDLRKRFNFGPAPLAAPPSVVGDFLITSLETGNLGIYDVRSGNRIVLESDVKRAGIPVSDGRWLVLPDAKGIHVWDLRRVPVTADVSNVSTE